MQTKYTIQNDELIAAFLAHSISYIYNVFELNYETETNA